MQHKTYKHISNKKKKLKINKNLTLKESKLTYGGKIQK